MVRKRMDVMYLNSTAEGVRQVALRNFKEIYGGIVKDLKSSLSFWNGKEHAKTRVINELIEKYEELTK